jgi:peptidoglycan/LPS O-acetylase OafA/YrhL
MIPPAWSLAIELQFYMIAPFVVARDIRIVLAVLVVSLAFRFSLLDSDFVVWRYAYAPADACFFMMGVASHRLSQLIDAPRLFRKAGLLAIVALPVLAYACDLSAEKDLDVASLWVFYVAFAAALPFLFFLSRHSHIDRVVGDVSYPLYVSHWNAIAATLFFLGAAVPEPYVPIVDFVMALIVALALMMLVEGPVERFRLRFSRRTIMGAAATSPA